MRIALFGMSADPPHRGHGDILSWLAQHFDHVAVWASDNPFKEHQCPLRDRAAMLELMIQDLPVAAGKIALHEDLSHRRSLISAQRARDRWPQASLSLVVGADLVEQLPRWYQSQMLFQLVEILVIPRPGYPLSEAALEPIRQAGGTVTIADSAETFAISSSYYRQTEDPEALPASVRAYINQKNLYPCTESSKEKQPIV
ncbi:MAG: nicotinate-nucleotide adenylyltransferase [Leptolyngbyaceae cyanobacterium]